MQNLDLTQSNMQAALMQGLTLKGTTLSELMGSPDYEKARTAFKQITGMDLQLFNQFKPFMSLNLLALYAIPAQIKFQPETLSCFKWPANKTFLWRAWKH